MREAPHIAIFYGSTDGNTARVARLLQQKLTAALDPTAAGRLDQTPDQTEGEVDSTVELFDVAEFYLDEMVEFDYLILGIPTWNTGQMQSDWDEAFGEFDALDLSGKQVALFGLGDQADYANTFVDALFFLAEKAQERGAHLVGRWSMDGYTFEQSWAVQDGQFVGLVIDEHNQPHLTEMRVSLWAAQLKVEFGLATSSPE